MSVSVGCTVGDLDESCGSGNMGGGGLLIPVGLHGGSTGPSEGGEQ